MSKTYLRAANLALGLAQDAYGNNISGNEVRAMRYLELCTEVLEVLTKAIENKGDVRASMALDGLSRRVVPELDKMDREMPFSPARLVERREFFEKHGIKGNALKTIDPALIEQLGVKRPEGGGTSVAVKLSGEDAERLLQQVASH